MERKPPFFIVGVPRSGTTLMAVLLNNHSEIHVGKTTPAHGLLELHRRLMDGPGLDGDVRRHTPAERLRLALHSQALVWELCQNVADQTEEGLRSLLAHAREEVSRRHGKTLWGDKSPFMLNEMPLLSHLMPGVRFIHIIRDGRAVAQSRNRRRGHHPKLAIHEWKRMILQGRVDGEIVGPDRYLEVKYEDLLRHPREAVTRVCAFLGVEFEERMLDLGQAEGADQPEAYVGKQLDASKIEAWQDHLTRKQVEALECIAGDLLQALGYPLQSYSPEGPFRALSPLAVLWHHQQLSFRDLVQAKRTTMVNQRVVEISPRLATRLRRFIGESAARFLSDRLIEHFRKPRITVG